MSASPTVDKFKQFCKLVQPPVVDASPPGSADQGVAIVARMLLKAVAAEPGDDVALALVEACRFLGIVAALAQAGHPAATSQTLPRCRQALADLQALVSGNSDLQARDQVRQALHALASRAAAPAPERVAAPRAQEPESWASARATRVLVYQRERPVPGVYRILTEDDRDAGWGIPAPIARLVESSLPAGFDPWSGQDWNLATPLVVDVLDAPPDEAPPGLTDFFQAGQVAIVSERLRDAVHACEPEVRFWPVELRDHPAPAMRWFAVNPLLRVDSARFDETAFTGGHWVLEPQGRHVFVSPAIQEALRNSTCVGYRFVDPTPRR